MISKLEITGFKRFASCTLDLAPLTVLTGLNGAGKTSFIQALLLCREASVTRSGTVPLNGPFGMDLGSALDVVNVQGGPFSEINMSVHFSEGVTTNFCFDARETSLLHVPLLRRTEPILPPLGGPDRGFSYLCAERLGPREILGSSALRADDFSVGVRGEYCAQILDIYELKEKVPAGRRHPDRMEDADAFLKYQVEAWLSDIVRPIEIDVAKFTGTSVRALRFRTPGDEWVRAPNMGFGVSYCLPVVLAGLFVSEGGLLIIENPEAHLHPTGQSRIGTFLAMLAAAGVQVVLETHSDHVLNGIRRAIGEHKVPVADKALVHFFDIAEDRSPKISTLRFTSTGNLNEWPHRFFDQYQIDVAALARVRRGPPR